MIIGTPRPDALDRADEQGTLVGFRRDLDIWEDPYNLRKLFLKRPDNERERAIQYAFDEFARIASNRRYDVWEELDYLNQAIERHNHRVIIGYKYPDPRLIQWIGDAHQPWVSIRLDTDYLELQITSHVPQVHQVLDIAIGAIDGQLIIRQAVLTRVDLWEWLDQLVPRIEQAIALTVREGIGGIRIEYPTSYRGPLYKHRGDGGYETALLAEIKHGDISLNRILAHAQSTIEGSISKALGITKEIEITGVAIARVETDSDEHR